MLLLPAFQRIGNVTVYADDEVWYKFYAVSGTPRLRMNEEGRPAFLLVKYMLPDEVAEEEGSEAARGGGYLNLDVQLALTDDEQADVKRSLQRWVDEEFQRRKRDPVLRDHPSSRGSEPPKALLSEPTWSTGTVRMFAPTSELLVTGSVAEQPAALVAGNTAVFSMDLSPAGATFMQQTLAADDGWDAIDLTPIQVGYELKLWARLPPVRIKITSDSERIYKSLQSLVETEQSTGSSGTCTQPEIRSRYTSQGMNASRLEETGAIEVVVDKGDARLSDEQVAELRQMALSMVEGMIQQRFLTPVDDGGMELTLPGPTDEEQSTAPGWVAVVHSQPGFTGEAISLSADMEAVTGAGGAPFVPRSVRVRKGHQVTLYASTSYMGRSVALRADSASLSWSGALGSARVFRPSTVRYALAARYDKATMHVDLDLVQSQVVEWGIAPQATLETFLGHLTPNEVRQHIRVVRMDDESLHLSVRAFATFEDDGVAFVEVQVIYRGRHEDGQPDEKTRTFTFTRAGEAQTWDPARIGDSRQLEYRWRVGYDGRGEGPWSEWVKTEQPEININVEDPGKLEVEVLTAGVSFEIVRSIEVDIRYRDPEAGVPEVHEVVLLDQAERSGKLSRMLYTELRQPVEVRATYRLSNDETVEGELIRTTGKQVIIPPPPVDLLDVAFMPTGDWSEVERVAIAVRRRGSEGLQQDRIFELQDDKEFVTWQALLSRPDERGFEYQITVDYKGQQQEARPWQQGDGDGVIQVHVEAPPRLVVNVFSNLVDFALTPVITISLRAGENGQTLSFTKKEQKTWTVPLPLDASRRYAYTLAYHKADGEVVSMPEVATDATELFLPPLREGTSASEVRLIANLVNYTATPLVEVFLRVLGEGGAPLFEDSLLFTETKKEATLPLDVPAGSAPRLLFETTYYLPDGTPVARPVEETTRRTIVLRAYAPGPA